jgi:hypothetical protein
MWSPQWGACCELPLIRPGEAEIDDPIEQRRRPQMRIIDQPLPAVDEEILHRLRPGRLALTRTALAVQIRTDRLAVMAEMVGERGDRPGLYLLAVGPSLRLRYDCCQVKVWGRRDP